MPASQRILSDGSVELTLGTPINVGTERIEKLTLRPLKTPDMRSLPAGDESAWNLGVFLDLASRLAEVPPSTIDALDPADALEVVGIAAVFFGRGRQTGGSASAN